MKKKMMLTMLVGGLALSNAGISLKHLSPNIDTNRHDYRLGAREMNKTHKSYMNMHNNQQTITSTAQPLSDNPSVSVLSVVNDYFNPRTSHEWSQYKMLCKLMAGGNYETFIQKMHEYYGGSQK